MREWSVSAMLSFLAKSRPPRTNTAHGTKLFLDGGLSMAEFKAPGDRFLVINRLPPAASPSSLAPPLHRHWWQDETFHVISGTAKFTLGVTSSSGSGSGSGSSSSKQRTTTTLLARKGEMVTIPAREAHTFCNASTKEELVLEFALAPSDGRGNEDEEAYFRNVWGYRNDCARTGTPPSVFQALSFMYGRGGRGVVVKVVPFGPEWFSQWAGYALTYVGGLVIGRRLLGYQGSYPEYYFRELPR